MFGAPGSLGEERFCSGRTQRGTASQPWSHSREEYLGATMWLPDQWQHSWGSGGLLECLRFFPRGFRPGIAGALWGWLHCTLAQGCIRNAAIFDFELIHVWTQQCTYDYRISVVVSYVFDYNGHKERWRVSILSVFLWKETKAPASVCNGRHQALTWLLTLILFIISISSKLDAKKCRFTCWVFMLAILCSTAKCQISFCKIWKHGNAHVQCYFSIEIQDSCII